MDYTTRMYMATLNKSHMVANAIKLPMNSTNRIIMSDMARDGLALAAHSTKRGLIWEPVDETEFWTPEDFEEHRAQCYMTEEEYYGTN